MCFPALPDRRGAGTQGVRPLPTASEVVILRAPQTSKRGGFRHMISSSVIVPRGRGWQGRRRAPCEAREAKRKKGRGKSVISLVARRQNFPRPFWDRLMILQFSGSLGPFHHSRRQRWGILPPINPIGRRHASLRDSPADITYNLNNVCDAGASPVPDHWPGSAFQRRVHNVSITRSL